MRVLALSLALCFLGSGRIVRAEDSTTTAADTTETGRRLDHALDVVLDGSNRAATGPRTLCIVVDATPSLTTAGFAEHFDAALERNAAKLATTEIQELRNATVSRQFNTTGTFPYDCTLHPGMKGEVVVNP